MAETVNVQPATEEGSDWEAAVTHIFEQIEQADIRIREHHAESDRLKAETRAMLADLRRRLPVES